MATRRSREESTAGIKDAAVRLFAHKGYANTSLDDVASAAGFTKGAVYYYFKSKENLLLSVLTDIEERSIDQTAEAVHAQPGTVLDKMIRFSICQGRWAASSPDDLAILMLVSIATAKAKNRIRKRVLNFYAKMEALLTQVVEQGKAKGELPPDFSTEDAVTTTIANHDGNMLLWYRSGCDLEVGRMLTASGVHMLTERFASGRTHAPATAVPKRKERSTA